MTDNRAPDEIRRLAEARRAARSDRNWAEADRLKAEIEAAGWNVVDRGPAFSLERAHPPDVEEDGHLRYGSSVSVPSALGEPASARATIVRAVPDDASAVATAPPGSDDLQVVLVAHRPTADLPPGDPEVILLNGWPGAAAALNAGIRRARGAVVVVASPETDVTDRLVDLLVASLADPTVAIAGPWGLDSDDLRRFHPVHSGDAVAIDGRLLAFRRADYVERGPLDEAYADPYRLDVWWSLTLRDNGPDETPRRALVVGTGDEDRPATTGPAPDDDQHDGDEGDEDDAPVTPGDPARRRNFYRLIRWYGGARHLLRE